MTTPVPDWAKITPSPSINTPPQEVPSAAPALTAQRIGVIGEVLVTLILAQVALALGNVTVLGVRPFEFLSQWGRDLQQQALDAYLGSQVAQGSANYANSQLSILTGGALASNVEGGVAVSDTFSGSSANDLGGSWTRTSDGSGAGNFGPNGTGQAVWKKSGGLSRRHFDIHITELATDYQAAFAVIAQPPEAPSFGSDAYTYLLLRVEDDDTFVYCRIGRTTLQVGKRAGGTWSDWATVTITANTGDQITFIAGTNTDDRQFLVRQNGITRIDHTDTTSSALGAAYRSVGIVSQSAERNFLTDQTRPAELDVWSAADRLPETV